MADKIRPFMLDDARILFRNFSGREGQYNREGDRNFCVVLDEETATRLAAADWNIKYLKPREEEDLPQPYIQVKVSYSKKIPRVVLLTSRGKTDLDESTVSALDFAEIKKVDLSINPYPWEVNGKSGIKAYLKSIYVTIEEDPLELRYMDVPDSGTNTLPFVPMDDSDD